MYSGFKIINEDLKFLDIIKNQLKAALPIVPEIKWNTFGIKVEFGKITGLGLYNKSLTFGIDLPSNLKSLALHSCKIKDLNILKNLKDLTDLASLVLNNNYVELIPQLPKSLKSLELAKNNIQIFSRNKNDLPNLRLLDLSNNGNLKFAINDLIQSLTVLKLENTGLNEFNTDNSLFPNIKYLNLNLNLIEAFNGKNYPNLIELHLVKNKLDTIDLENVNLISIKLAGNNLKSIDFAGLPVLEIAYLGGNKIDIVNNFPGSLEIIYLENNPITTLPSGLLKLNNLKKINLKGTAVSLDDPTAAELGKQVKIIGIN